MKSCLGLFAHPRGAGPKNLVGRHMLLILRNREYAAPSAPYITKISRYLCPHFFNCNVNLYETCRFRNVVIVYLGGMYLPKVDIKVC